MAEFLSCLAVVHEAPFIGPRSKSDAVACADGAAGTEGLVGTRGNGLGRSQSRRPDRIRPHPRRSSTANATGN
ncbi:hypothetical protein LP420_28035 [Massilia sp. B-10]|nr:hypothetical protein LP420_28035 [Massilia sp. B-10]